MKAATEEKKAQEAEPEFDEVITEPGTPEAEANDEELTAIRFQSGLLEKFQAADPDRWQKALEVREQYLGRLRDLAIRRTVPEDWTVYKDRDGTVIGVPRDSGCTRMRKWMGITVSNYRPKNARGDAEPDVRVEKIGEGKYQREVTIVTMLADGYCHTTGETIEDVRFSVRSDMPFTGREEPDFRPREERDRNPKPKRIILEDLRSSCRTGLDSKITRLLSDTRKVPADVLKEHGIDWERAYKGHGFGTSSDRGAQKAADPGVKEKALELGREIMKRVGGDKSAAQDLLVDVTKSPDGKFKGFRSVERLTQEWQIENAWKALRAHEVFGDQGSEGESEPGANG